MQVKRYITENEKLDILVHLIAKGYLTKNQIKAIIKRGN